MTVNKLVVPAVCLIAGIAIGAFVLPGPYSYGENNGAHTRVNRFTGVEQYASSKGWVSQQEIVADGMGTFFGGMKRMTNGFGEVGRTRDGGTMPSSLGPPSTGPGE